MKKGKGASKSIMQNVRASTMRRGQTPRKISATTQNSNQRLVGNSGSYDRLG